MEVLYGFMGKSWEYMGIPSGDLFQFAIENGLFDIVDLATKHGDFLQLYMYVYQRLTIKDHGDIFVDIT